MNLTPHPKGGNMNLNPARTIYVQQFDKFSVQFLRKRHHQMIQELISAVLSHARPPEAAKWTQIKRSFPLHLFGCPVTRFE
jgi:hypothetical protein